MSYRHKHIKPKLRNLRRRKKIIQKKGFWIILLVILSVSTIFYFIMFFPKFQVSHVEISGNEKIEKKDIENITWGYLNKKLFGTGIFNISSKSIFIVNKKNLIKDILSNFSNIEDVQIKKDLPNSLILKVKERQPFAVFCQENNCFFIDENGVIFESLETRSKDMIIIMSDYMEILIGKEIIGKNIMDIISIVEKNLKDNFQIDIKEVFVSNTLIFKTSENWKVYFDPTSDIDLQITKMNSILENEITQSDRKNLQYIYLQYQDKAYYK